MPAQRIHMNTPRFQLAQRGPVNNTIHRLSIKHFDQTSTTSCHLTYTTPKIKWQPHFCHISVTPSPTPSSNHPTLGHTHDTPHVTYVAQYNNWCHEKFHTLPYYSHQWCPTNAHHMSSPPPTHANFICMHHTHPYHQNTPTPPEHTHQNLCSP